MKELDFGAMGASTMAQEQVEMAEVSAWQLALFVPHVAQQLQHGQVCQHLHHSKT